MVLGSAVVTVGFGSQALASPAAAKTKTTHSNYTLSCKAPPVGNGNVTVDSYFTYPASVKPGQKFKFKWYSVTTVLPPLSSLGDSAVAPQGGTIKGATKITNVTSTDAKPAKANTSAGIKLPKGWPFSTGKYGPDGIPIAGTLPPTPPGGNFKIRTPVKGTETTGTFTAGKKGTDKVTAGEDDAWENVYKKNGSIAISADNADCSFLKGNNTIALVTVS
jgi:hypothetical protein